MQQWQLNAFADEAADSLQGQIEAMRRNGITGLEIRGVNGKNVSDLTDEEAREIAARLSDAGMFVWSLGSRCGKTSITEDFAPALADWKRTLQIAHLLNARRIRMFSFYLPAQQDPALYRQAVLDRLYVFAQTAQEEGILACHENEKGIYGDIAARCLEIHQQVPQLRCVFDPANYVQCGQDTMEAWELLAPYVDYMHIKDALPDGFVVPAGQGAGHVPQLVARYCDQGGRAFTVEPHLTVFSGLRALEREGDKSAIAAFRYPSRDAAFDAASAALRAVLSGIKA